MGEERKGTDVPPTGPVQGPDGIRLSKAGAKIPKIESHNLVQKRRGRQAIHLDPSRRDSFRVHQEVELVLLILTLFSTLFAGTMWYRGCMDFVRRPWLGLPFAICLMGILGAHELGHYFAARQYGVPVSLPYFIPMPLGPFGTLGAFISMKAPPPNRRALLTIAAAGPLSGLILAVPILLLGLSLSPITQLVPGDGIVMEGNSILYALLKIVSFGRFLPSGGEDVLLHPIAFAGWAGLLVTGLNLIPVGQLDGGHILYALFGERSRQMICPPWSYVMVGFVWNGWFCGDTDRVFAGNMLQHWMISPTFVSPE